MAKKDLNEDIFSGEKLAGAAKPSGKASKKQKKIKMPNVSQNTAKIIKSVVAAVIVVALLASYVCTGAVRKGFIHSTLQWTTHLTAATVKSDDGTLRIPVSTYNYYFAAEYNNMRSTKSSYEQYGLDPADYNLGVDFDKPFAKQTTTNDDDEVITWLEYINKNVLESIKITYSYYNEAVKANNGEEPDITDEQKAQLEETVSSYKEAANQYGYTASGYLVQAMGRGVTEKVFRRETIRSYIAQNYSESLNEDVQAKEYTADDFNAYKDEHIDELNSVDIKLFEAETADDAKAFYNELKADGSNFAELAVKYSKDDYEKRYYAGDEATTLLNATKAVLQSGNTYAISSADEHDHTEDEHEHSYPGLDWLFSTDRSAGEKYQYSTSVVYMIKPVGLSDSKLVNVRHILISPLPEDSESTDATSATSEQWDEAYKKAQSIVDEFNSGNKNEDSFAALAQEYSSDGNASNGGLYENVYPHQMVNSFDSWCFNEARKAGDVQIVQTQFGYHIIYFSGETDTLSWEYTAKNALASADSNSMTEELKSKYEAKMNWFGKFYVEIDTDIDS